MTDSNLKSYAQFNSFQITGRISNIDLVNGRNGDFLAISLISNLMTDDAGVTVKFLDSVNLMTLYTNGKLPVGRMVTVTGHIKAVSQTYTNSIGEVVMLKRPLIELVDANIPTGGLGPIPTGEGGSQRRTATVVRPSDANQYAELAVDETPAY